MTYTNRRFTIPMIVWIIAGIILPLISVAFYGLSNSSGSFTLDNVLSIFRHEHLKALGLSLLFAFLSTLVCFLLAFPLAMIMRNSRFGKHGFTIFILILPMWMNFLLRTMAWQVLLERNGVINSILTAIGLPRLEMMNTAFAIVLGMVYDFLPFMILPIYNSVCQIENSVIEAARDLGASRPLVFTKVILPLSVPGIVSGIIMVFIPSLTTFAISNMLGGGKFNLIGNIIEQEFTVNSNWYLGAGLSLVMMIFIIFSMLLIQKFDKSSGQNLL